MHDAMMRCPTCKGHKTVILTKKTFGSDEVERSEIPCVICKGVGMVKESVIKEIEEFWCNCEVRGKTQFYADGEHRDLYKHHYRCLKCGRVTQVG